MKTEIEMKMAYGIEIGDGGEHRNGRRYGDWRWGGDGNGRWYGDWRWGWR